MFSFKEGVVSNQHNMKTKQKKKSLNSFRMLAKWNLNKFDYYN